MSNTAGKIMPRPMGEYSSTVTYNFLDMVTLDNRLYIARESNILGVSPIPTGSSKWVLLIDGVTDVDALEKVMNQKIDDLTSRISLVESNKAVVGTNMFVNSSFRKNSNNWRDNQSPTFVELDGIPCAKFEGAFKEPRNIIQSIIGQVEPDTTYTMSGWVRTDNIVLGTINPTIMFYTDGYYDLNGTRTWFGYEPKEFTKNAGVGKWEHLTCTFRTDQIIKKAYCFDAYVFARDFTGQVYWYNLKLEKGDKATVWSPAPTDELIRNLSRERKYLFQANLWSSSAPYTMTAHIDDSTQYDKPIAYLIDDSTTEADSKAKKKAYGCVTWFESNTDSITATCKYKKPTVDFLVGFKGV